MKSVKIILFGLIAAFAGEAFAATVHNGSDKAVTFNVSEGGKKTALSLLPGEEVDFCMNGCFVTYPNGDLEALSGSERVEIKDGKFKSFED